MRKKTLRDTDPEHRAKLKKCARKSMLKTKFGMTLEQFDHMLKVQGGCCKVCGVTKSGRWGTLYIDHCHTSGTVRGLLCNRCNLAIGNMGDDPRLLRRAAEYLEQSKERK